MTDDYFLYHLYAASSESVVCEDRKVRACQKRKMSSSFEIKCTNRPSYMSFCKKSCGGCIAGKFQTHVKYQKTNFDKIII